jgi:hypothetical protein
MQAAFNQASGESKSSIGASIGNKISASAWLNLIDGCELAPYPQLEKMMTIQKKQNICINFSRQLSLIREPNIRLVLESDSVQTLLVLN